MVEVVGVDHVGLGTDLRASPVRPFSTIIAPWLC